MVWWSNPSGVADYCMGLDNDTVLDAAAVCVSSETFRAGHVNHSRAKYNLVRPALVHSPRG